MSRRSLLWCLALAALLALAATVTADASHDLLLSDDRVHELLNDPVLSLVSARAQEADFDPIALLEAEAAAELQNEMLRPLSARRHRSKKKRSARKAKRGGKKGGKKGRKGGKKKKEPVDFKPGDKFSTVPAMAPAAPEVFYYATGPGKFNWDNTPGSAYPWNKREDAEAACKSIGATLATAAQLQAAYEAGAEWCSCGATKDDKFSFPMQRVAGGCGGKKGVTNTCTAGGANCFGVKPLQGKTPGVAPFAPGRYHQVAPVLTKQAPDGYKPTHIKDWGYAYDRVWFDAVGDGQLRDYGRWVGNAPNIRFSVALRDCPEEKSATDVYVLKDGVVTAGPAYKKLHCPSKPIKPKRRMGGKAFKSGDKISTISAMSPLAPEVFYYAVGPMKFNWNNTPGAAYPWNKREDAEAACKSIGATLATAAQLQAAYQAGAEWCSCGATKDDKFSFPMQRVAGGCGGKKGVTNTCTAGGANCFGIKPHQGKVAGVAPFAPGRYHQVAPTLSKQSPDGFKPTLVTDWGYAYDRVWLDAVGDGKHHDYGRWVGNSPNIWFAVALRDCPDQFSKKDVYVIGKDGVVSAGPAYKTLDCPSKPMKQPGERKRKGKRKGGKGKKRKFKRPPVPVKKFKVGDKLQSKPAMSPLAPEVFYYAVGPMKWVWNGNPGSAYPWNKREEAAAACKSIGATLATAAQLRDAQSKGAEWCACGGIADDNFSYPMQRVAGGCGNKIGVINSCTAGGANCYGVKPHLGKTPGVTSFAPGRYHQVEPTLSKKSPANYSPKYITDWGYAYDRVWVDALGDGKLNDYGRWVGNSPNIWFAVALRDCPDQYSAKDVYVIDKNGVVSTGPKYNGFDCPSRPLHFGRLGKKLDSKPASGDPKAGSPTGSYKNPTISDWGYSHDRTWVDVLGDGKFDHYGRWVGNPGGIWFSVALKDCPAQYSGVGEFVFKDGDVYRGANYTKNACIKKWLDKKKRGKPFPSVPAPGDPKVAPSGYKSTHITDWGYGHDRMWLDVRGAGVKNDYGRWVGNNPNIWYSIALWDCPNQYSAPGEYVLEDGKVYKGPKYKGFECPSRPKPPAPKRPAFDPASRHKSGVITLAPSGYKNRYITDWGYPHDRQWVDVRGAGVREDYGRWVGKHPDVWYSIALKDCPNQYSARGEWILEEGKVKRGPKYKGSECSKPKTTKKKWKKPADGEPWRAPPLKQPHYDKIKHARASVEKEEPAKLKCPSGLFIDVRDATFGAGAGIWQSSGWINKGSCHIKDSRIKAAEKCNTKNECELEPSAKTFGATDTGAECARELLVTYVCVDSNKKHPLVKPVRSQPAYEGISVREVKDGEEAFLSCDAGKLVAVLDASYGSRQGFYASNGFIKKGKCHAANSATTMAANCQGKASCKVKVSASTFPLEKDGKDQEACPSGAAKKLKLTYRCTQKAVPFSTPVAPPPRAWSKVKRAPEVVVPQPAEHTAVQQRGDQVLKIGNSEVHIHLTQLSPPEPHAAALSAVEQNLDALHDNAMKQIETLLDDIDTQRKSKKPNLQKLERTIEEFKAKFNAESQKVQLATHKFNYADNAPTLV